MKKLFVLLVSGSVFMACNDAEHTDADMDKDQDQISSPAPEQTYTPSEGDVILKNDKVMVMRNGEWVEAEDKVELDNGIVVNKDGKVMKDGNEMELEEGEVVTSTGRFFDKTGRAIENAWKDMKTDVGDAAERMGNDVDKAVDGDNK